MPITSEADWDDVDEESSLRSALCVICTLSSSLWSAQVSPALSNVIKKDMANDESWCDNGAWRRRRGPLRVHATPTIRRLAKSLLHRPPLDRDVSVREWR